MHKCIVCGNTSNDTNINRPEVMYHLIPENKYMRRKWLEDIGIDCGHGWQYICTDHFVEEKYKQGKKQFLFSNAIPQPCDRNDFPSNYATQSNDVETGNNVILPMEQNIIKEEHIGNTVVNNFKSPRRSSRLTRNNEDMSNKNMPDHTLVSGLRCSVKSCSNRVSKNVNLFAYPEDLTLRKLWMEKCRLKKNPAEMVMSSTRVCSIHFSVSCFMNTKLKNRLRPGAVPSLFLKNDIINTKNIPSLSFCVNRWLHNQWLLESNEKPSNSSSNYVTNVETNKIPLSMFISSTTSNAKGFKVFCSVPECITNTKKEVEDISLFVPRKEHVKEWSKILGVRLTISSIVCEKHFRSQDMLENESLVIALDKQFKLIGPYALPVPMNEEPVLRTSEKKRNNLKDSTDDSYMTIGLIDLTVDD